MWKLLKRGIIPVCAQKTAHHIYQIECAECSKTEALPADPANTYKKHYQSNIFNKSKQCHVR